MPDPIANDPLKPDGLTDQEAEQIDSAEQVDQNESVDSEQDGND